MATPESLGTWLKLGDAAKSIIDDFVKDPATGKMVRKSRGGPTVAEPDRPYCKDDQSCCDYTCGN